MSEVLHRNDQLMPGQVSVITIKKHACTCKTNYTLVVEQPSLQEKDYVRPHNRNNQVKQLLNTTGQGLQM